MVSRSFISVIFLGLASLCGGEQERPNFLWLTIEDTSADEFGCYGNPDVRTPTIDKLAAEGIRYTNAWSVGPQCSTARSSLITGCYGTTYNMDTHRYKYPQPESIPLYPKFLREAGYYTTNKDKTDYNIAGSDERIRNAKPSEKIWNEAGQKNHPATDGSYLNRAPGQPFFAVFNTLQTHMSRLTSVGLEGRPDFREDGLNPNTLRLPPHVPDNERMRSDLAFHLQGIQDIDLWVAEHLRVLETEGLTEDTIIFFYSDHGGCLPRGKGWAYETGLHVPLIIYVPPKWQQKLGVIPGTVSDELVSFIDFAPTVFNIIGIDTPEAMHGQAFLGPNRPAPRDYQFGFAANGKSAIRPARIATDGEFNFIRHYISYRPDALRNQFQWRMPSNLAWDDYLFWEPGDNAVWNAVKRPIRPERLFNVSADPYETRDLSQDPKHHKKLQALEDALDQHIHDTADLGFFPVLSRFKDDGSLYEWVRRTDYDLPALHAAAKTAATASPEDIPDLEALLSSQNSEMRFWGAVGFANLGSDGHAIAIPEALRQALEDPNGEVAVAAAEAIALLGDLDSAYHALVRLIQEPMDRENRMQYVKREHNQRRYAGAALEMLSINEATQPIVHRFLEACEEGRVDQATDYEIQSLRVNLGQAPARSLYPDFDVVKGQLRRPMGPLP